MKRLLYFLLITFAASLAFSSALSAQPAAWSLKDCIDKAIRENVQLNISRRSNDANAVNLAQAKYAQYPSLNGSGNQVFNFGRSLDPGSYTYVNRNISSNSFGLSSSVVLFEGLQLVSSLKADKLNFEAGKLDIETFKNNISLNVAGAYLQILLDFESIGNAANTIETDKQQIDITNVKVTAGAIPELSLYQIKAQLAADKLNLANAQNQLAVDKLTLKQLMNMPDSIAFDIEKPVLRDPPSYIDSTIASPELYAQSVGRQPQVQSSEKKLQASMFAVQAAKGSLYPRLLLGANITTAYSDARTRLNEQVVLQNRAIGYLQGNPDQLVYGEVPYTSISKSNYPFFSQLGDNLSESIPITLSIPIFNNYTAKANVQQALINRDIARLNDQYTRDQFRKTVEQSYTDLLSANKQYLAALESFRAEEEALDIMNVKYKGGSASASDLILERNRFTSSQSAVLQSKYQYIFKQKVLDFYLGKPFSL
jgi:outer membrane protein